MTENSSFAKTEFKCNDCNKIFATNGGLWKHNKKYHNDIKIVKIKQQYFCKKCKTEFMSRTTKWRHEKSCNVTTSQPADLVKKVDQMEQTIKLLQNTIISQTKPSNQTIEPETNPNYFAFNNLKLYPNKQTGYIDITPIATIPDKLFNTWITQESTLSTITGISQQTGIPISQLFFDENTQTQIHQDLAVEFIKWLSPVNGIKFTQWIGQEKPKVINVNTPTQTTQINQTEFKSIQTNTIPDNVVYIITSPVHRKMRTYIIGKAQNIKSRLSNYNKSIEHEVVYYVQCHTGKIAHLVESMVLTRLHKYREVVNRDRFVLPPDTPLTLFTDVLDEAIGFFSSLFESDTPAKQPTQIKNN